MTAEKPTARKPRSRKTDAQEPMGSMDEEPAADPREPQAPPGMRVVDGDGIAWLVLDEPGKRVNTLSARFLDWFEAQLAELEGERPRGLVICSGKPDTFVAGADIEELRAATGRDQVLDVLARGHALTGRLDDLPLPTVAAIHGACLGGGLELALACDLRVATEHPKTKLGLPEVQLGLIPGLGGTQRLPRLIAVPDALDLILTGKQVTARVARRLGLVDEICHPHDLPRAAVELLAQAGSAALSRRRQRGRALASRAGDFLARSFLGDRLVYERAREEVRRTTGGHYPAPFVAIDIVKDGLELPLPRALELEAGAFSELVTSPTAKSLMGIFFRKNDVEARAAKQAQGARKVEQIGVLGAGFMGSGVAQVLAHQGYRVVMKDRDLAAVGRGLAFARKRFDELVARRRYRPVERELALSRILATVEYRHLQRSSFVIEAVFEDLELKRRVIRELEEVAPDDLIFASNTSTIPIALLAEASRRPENVVGMHFFSPVHRMPLIEVVRHPGTSVSALATTVEVGRRMGKTVIVVGDGPGFFTSRVLGLFLNEAAWMLLEGAEVAEIDGALTRWGWPVGPITLLDEVGLDVAHHAGSVVQAHLGERVAPPPVFAHLLSDGRTGRKSSRGFYLYEGGKKGAVDDSNYRLLGWQKHPVPEREIVERCVFQMLNETARCIEEGIIANPADIDLGVVFGFGFPPFRGGLLEEADRIGIGTIVDRLDRYADRHGERLRPAPLLRRMAEKGERFHSGP
jgi:3-hydroxyacyl-CoA dehydrogenase/enoyl-CoA hydratase/3-hydroxybutyryl-CoA epimerase